MTSSAATHINDDIHFAWQAQYLVRLEGDFSWQAQHFVTFWEIAGARNVVFYNTKIVSKMGRVRSPKRRGARWRFCVRIMLGYRRISSNRLSIGGSTSGSFRSNLELQDFVAGAVFGEVGGWLYLLRALEMPFHMWRRSVMTFIFAWQAQYLVKCESDFSWQAQHFVTFWEITLLRVILRTFYRQILSLLYGSFFFWNFRHRLARELLVNEVYWGYNPLILTFY